MTLDQDIRAWLSRFADGEVGIEQLEEWFIPETWADGSALVDEVTHLLVEHSNGDRTEAEVRHLVRGMVGRTDIVFNFPVVGVGAGTAVSGVARANFQVPEHSAIAGFFRADEHDESAANLGPEQPLAI